MYATEIFIGFPSTIYVQWLVTTYHFGILFKRHKTSGNACMLNQPDIYYFLNTRIESSCCT